MVHATRSNVSVNDVLPGDEDAVEQVEGLFRRYVETRDPLVREQIIVAYLGLADRLADRYRSSRGASPEDLRGGPGRAGRRRRLLTPTSATRSSPTRSPAWSARSSATCATPAGGSTSPGR